MSRFSTTARLWFFAATVVSLPAMAATPLPAQMPAHKAFAQPSASGTACMNANRMVSHVAYLPASPAETLPCGHLLSTDTVLTVHHWDKT